MLTEQVRHDQKSVVVFLTVALLHAALLYLLSVTGGLWIKPPHDTQPLTVSFITERATANKTSKKDTLDTSRNAQKQKKVSKRSPETKKTNQKTSPTVESTQQKTQQKPKIPEPIQNTSPAQPVAAANTPSHSDPKKATPDKPAQSKEDATGSSEVAGEPSKTNLTPKKSLGVSDIEPFSQHIESKYKAIINPPITKPEQANTKTQDEYKEYEDAVKNILDDVDEFTTDDAGQAKTHAKKDSNWGKLTSPEDSRVEASYKNRVPAVYPEEELAVGREGIVLFEFKLNRQGKVVEDSINIVSETSVHFLREAKIALLASEFAVTMKHGVLINENVKIAITFSLDEFEEDEFDF